MTLKLSRFSRAARRAAAFTMVEIAISIGVIGFALVAIIGILPIGLNVQKDNREVTLINFDANFLMNAIRNGARGQDDLTNYIVTITNFFTIYHQDGTFSASGMRWYNTSNSWLGAELALTNGQNIVGLLTMPKYGPATDLGGKSDGSFYSNYLYADFRTISGSLVDQGVSAGSRDFAFKYRVYPEIMPSSSYAYAFTNSTINNYSVLNASLPDPYISNSVVGKELQNNLSEVRLRFRWPVQANGSVGLSHEVFRSSISGITTNFFLPGETQQRLYFIQSQVYGYAPQ